MEPTPILDFTIQKIIQLKKRGMISANPEYQRGEVWSESQKKKLIDSVMRGYPLPLIYLHYKKDEVDGMLRESFEVIDGQQRINALYEFAEGAIKLFDPVKDEKVAKFPNFIKKTQCPWAHCRFEDFRGDLEYLKNKFLETKLQVVKINTDNESEARDLFIRLQAGLPLNAQEKRDAWPGGYTEFVLKFGGKPAIHRYPGHDFFQKLVERQTTDKGRIRQLCGQVGMLFFERAVEDNWIDIKSQRLEDYYYKNIDFDINSPAVKRFNDVLDRVYDLLSDGKRHKLKGHETIHLILLVDSLMQDYTRSWENNFKQAFDQFRLEDAKAKKTNTGAYWTEYGSWTRTSTDVGANISRRHNFFAKKMFEVLQPQLKDTKRIFGELERQILYYRYEKKCPVCTAEIMWKDLEIHHVQEYQAGGKTTLQNGAPVHKDCHPKGRAAIEFAKKWEKLSFLLRGDLREIAGDYPIKLSSTSPVG